MMIHRALMLAIGNQKQMLKAAELLETYDQSIIEIYSQHMNAEHEAIATLMDDETWYSADAAIQSGLATGKGEPVAVQPAVASWYKHAPESVLTSTLPVVEARFPVNRQAAEIKNRAAKLQFVK